MLKIYLINELKTYDVVIHLINFLIRVILN